jgi:hypothetical protein
MLQSNPLYFAALKEVVEEYALKLIEKLFFPQGYEIHNYCRVMKDITSY